MVKNRANISIAIRLEARYLPLNGAITNFEHRDLGLYFQDHPISGIIFYRDGKPVSGKVR